MHLEPHDWPAPAKINLFLHVVGRRPDGYHLLQTVFQIIDLADTIRIRVTDEGAIRRLSGMPDVDAAQDLAVRAALLLQRASGSAQGAEIAVLKRIPAGAGLGGGSSDAATTLVALNAMWGTGLSAGRLAELGLELGADVPVFVHGHTAWAEGVGEKLSPLVTGEHHYVVVFPCEHVSTPEIFRDPSLTRNTPQTTIPRLLSGQTTRNDLEVVVCTRYPRVAAALEWLNGFAPARMSGSGSAVFAQFVDARAAAEVAGRCPADWQAFVVKGVRRSPLLQALDAWRGGDGRTGQT